MLYLCNDNKVVSSVGKAADPTPNYKTVSHHVRLLIGGEYGPKKERIYTF